MNIIINIVLYHWFSPSCNTCYLEFIFTLLCLCQYLVLF